MLLSTQQPFNLTHTLRFILSPPALLSGRQFDPLLDHFQDGEYRRVVAIAGQPVLYGVSEVKARKRTSLRVRVLAGPRGDATAAELRTLVERQLSTRLDLKPFYRIAAADRVLAHLVTHFRGMRIPQAASVYELLISAILEQQVNLSFAHQVKKALIQTYGTHINFDGYCYKAFPEPAALAITTPLELRRLQVSGPKARYIIGISRAVLDGSLDLEGLRQLDQADAQAKLIEQKGVGPWTAHYVGLRALGHLDCLPAADVGLQKAIQRFYGFRKQPTAARVEKLARAWAGWRSYATFYLWMTFWEHPDRKADLARQIRS
jgi:DNA-3-methyladenine glycosylase II